MGTELTGKTLGVLGCGSWRATGLLEMKLLLTIPLSPERAADLAVEKVELADLFERSDLITLHTPLTDSTRNILDEEAFGE